MAALDQRTRTALDVALEEACRALPHGGSHGREEENSRSTPPKRPERQHDARGPFRRRADGAD